MVAKFYGKDDVYGIIWCTVSLEIRMINSLSWLMLIEYPTSEYVRIAYVILLSMRNPIRLSRISVNKIINDG